LSGRDSHKDRIFRYNNCRFIERDSTLKKKQKKTCRPLFIKTEIQANI